MSPEPVLSVGGRHGQVGRSKGAEPGEAETGTRSDAPCNRAGVRSGTGMSFSGAEEGIGRAGAVGHLLDPSKGLHSAEQGGLLFGHLPEPRRSRARSASLGHPPGPSRARSGIGVEGDPRDVGRSHAAEQEIGQRRPSKEKPRRSFVWPGTFRIRAGRNRGRERTGAVPSCSRSKELGEEDRPVVPRSRGRKKSRRRPRKGGSRAAGAERGGRAGRGRSGGRGHAGELIHERPKLEGAEQPVPIITNTLFLHGSGETTSCLPPLFLGLGHVLFSALLHGI